MTEPHQAVIARLSTDFAAMAAYMARVSTDLVALDRVLSAPQTAPPPAPSWPPYQPPQPPAPAAPAPAPAPAAPQPIPAAAAPPRNEGWIGKLLAVAGVAVTLIGVVLLLVLAAQAGILRPEIRVAAGATLAVALVAAAVWMYARPGGRVGAIALAATGVAAAYMDVIAVTTIYEWVTAPAGLVIAAVIGGGGLTLARRWTSEQLGVLVLVPLLILAPIVTDGITLLLVGFMLALSAASLPVQIGRDWIWMYWARTAATTLPLLVALVAVYFGQHQDLWLTGGCGIAAVLAVVGALILLRASHRRVQMALATAAGVLPVLCVRLATDPVIAAVMAAVLSAALLAIVLGGDELSGVDVSVRQIWTALSAVAAVIAVLVAFDGRLASPVLLAMAIVVAVAGRRARPATWVAVGFAVVGAGIYLSYAPPSMLVEARTPDTAAGVSTLIASLLLIAFAVVTAGTTLRDAAILAAAAVVVGYAITTFTVTAGVLVGGESGGFFAGHMAATICWIVPSAGLFVYAARVARRDRSLPIGGGLALVAAAMAKLFLFDLGTLDGIFRVVVFIVVGLVLLGMGAGYARLLEKQDRLDMAASGQREE